MPQIYNDSIFCNDDDVAERIIYEYYSKLNKADSTLQNEALQYFLNSIKSPEIFDRFIDLTDLYLFNPYSPLRNEELYKRCLDSFLDNVYCTQIDSIKFAEQRKIILCNRPGSLANDLTYYFENDKVSLYVTGHGMNKLLFFYDADCEDCTNAIEWLANNRLINALIDNKQLVIIAVSDKDTSHNYLPPNWIKAVSPDYDKSYYISVTPSLYLLSQDNRVILKDVTDMSVLIDHLKKF